MDPGAGPLDTDEIIQRYARRLYVLAYHLTGDGAEADDLTMDVLMRSALAPDFPATEQQAGVFLSRLLIGMWKERLQSGNRGVGPRPVTPQSRAHDALWRALSRLDPVSRAVLILRLAEGLEYETIGRVLEMAADVVYARLLQARAGLRGGGPQLSPALFETMNLYLDARLPNEQRNEFERRMQADTALQEQVEFHRGLTLELHEETPPLPRDFLSRIQGRIERARETLALVDEAALSAGWEPVSVETPSRPRRWPIVVLGAAAAGLIVALSVALVIVVRRSSSVPGSAPAGHSEQQPAGAPAPTPDQATIEALRSLGYLAPGKERTPKNPPAKPARSPKAAKSSAGSAGSTPAATPAPAGTPAAAATPVPAGTPASAGTPAPAPSPASTPPSPGPEEPAAAWRVLRVERVPEPGLDHQVIGSRSAWALLFGEGAPVPGIDFEKEMGILLGYGPTGDPPSFLIVTSVQVSGEALVIGCRTEPAGSGSAPDGGTPTGQVVVLPITDRPIRIAIRRD